MNKPPSQTFMNLWDLPLLTRIISGVGRICMGPEFRGSAVGIYWIYRSQNPLTESDSNQLTLFPKESK